MNVQKYRFAVIHDGITKTGRDFYDLLKQPLWPDAPFASLIPVLVVPIKQLWGYIPETGVHGWTPNPDYQAEKNYRRSQVEAFAAAMQAQYPEVRIILQGWNKRDGWMTVNDPDNPQWEGILAIIYHLPPDKQYSKISRQ